MAPPLLVGALVVSAVLMIDTCFKDKEMVRITVLFNTMRTFQICAGIIEGQTGLQLITDRDQSKKLDTVIVIRQVIVSFQLYHAIITVRTSWVYLGLRVDGFSIL